MNLKKKNVRISTPYLGFWYSLFLKNEKSKERMSQGKWKFSKHSLFEENYTIFIWISFSDRSIT